MQEQALTEEELKAAREYLALRKSGWLHTNASDGKCNVCRDNHAFFGTLTVKRARHNASKPHIAGVYKIPISRLTKAIQIARVMEALDG